MACSGYTYMYNAHSRPGQVSLTILSHWYDAHGDVARVKVSKQVLNKVKEDNRKLEVSQTSFFTLISVQALHCEYSLPYTLHKTIPLCLNKTKCNSLFKSQSGGVNLNRNIVFVCIKFGTLQCQVVEVVNEVHFIICKHIQCCDRQIIDVGLGLKVFLSLEIRAPVILKPEE